MENSDFSNKVKNLLKLRPLDKKSVLKTFGPILAILFAFLLASLVVFISGGNPLVVYSNLIQGAFGSTRGLQNTLRYSLPIILLAFSFSICSQCGYFNIGQDGQIIAASLAVVWIVKLFPTIPLDVQILLMILVGAFFGAVVALIPALFKIWLGINEVVIAVLMNFILVLLSSYQLVYSRIAASESSTVMSIPIEPKLNAFLIIIAVILIVIGYSLSLQKTVPGFQLRMVGKNSRFAENCGINSTRIIMTAAIIGGVLSGLVAAGELLGVYGILYDGYAAGMGSNGIISALIGQHTPIGMILSSFVLGSLQSGSVLLSVNTDIPIQIIQVIQGFVMLFATLNFVSILGRPRARRNA